MMKLTFILVAVLLAVVPHESQASSLEKVLDSTHQKTKGIVDNVIAKVAETIEDAKVTVTKLGEELKNKVTESLQKVEAQVDKLLQKINNKVNEIVGDHDDPNLSECRRLAGTVLDTVLAVITNETLCVSEKLETGKGYIANISDVANEVTDQLITLQAEVRQCTDGVNGIKTTAEAIVCVNKVGFKAVWVSSKRVPEVTANVVKLGFLVSTLPITLPQCAVKNGFDTLIHNVDNLFNGVKECVKHSVGGDKHQPEVTKAPAATLPTTTEVTEAPKVTEPTTTEVTEAPKVTEPTTTEVTEAPEVTEPTTTEVTKAPEVTEPTNKHNEYD